MNNYVIIGLICVLLVVLWKVIGPMHPPEDVE